MDEQTYAKLFIDLADYRLPDGTEVQAIWTRNDPFGEYGKPPHWVLAHHDNPNDANSPRLQYEVRRDGFVIAVQWRPGEIVFSRPKRDQESYTDLCPDDFKFIVNPWESTG